jgi:sulfur carrier protein ThiS
MSTLILWIVGQDMRELDITDGTTLRSLAEDQGLTGYDFQVDGITIPRDQWASHVVDTSKELWASQGVKGAF